MILGATWWNKEHVSFAFSFSIVTGVGTGSKHVPVEQVDTGKVYTNPSELDTNSLSRCDSILKK